MVTSGLIIFAAVIAVIITSGVVYAKHQDTRHGCSRPAIAELFKSEKVPIDELSKVEQKMEDIGFVLDTKTTDRSEIGRALRGYGVDPTQGNLASASSWRCPTAFPILLGTRYSLIIESADGSLDLKMK
jgi:hypothetical protein